jgi:hypothetical protein
MEPEVDIEEKSGKEKEKALQEEKARQAARDAALNMALPWFIFVRTIVEMEDWYLSLVHASENPANSPTLAPLHKVFQASDMEHLVTTLDEQPDVIPMRWLNALIGRLFFSYYRTQILESYIIGRLMKKLSKVKRPAFLTDIVVTEVSVGNTAPTFSKPMLKELTKEGDASLEVQLRYKGEVRITIEATATINLGARFKSYTVKLVLAAVLREIEGNLLVKVKRPPSNRIWYAFTAPPKIVLDVEPIVSDRQITWSMILNTIESRLKEIVSYFLLSFPDVLIFIIHLQIQESVVMPNMDDIAFFESSKYNRRGGIWEDACRRERRATGIPGTPLADGTSSTVATPIPEGSVPVIIATESDFEPLKRSQSAQELAPEDGPSLEPVPVARSATHEGISDSASLSGSTSTGASSGTTRTRRRTWFSSAGSAELEALKDEVEPESGDSDQPRGRSTELDTSLAPRSKSTPESPHVEEPPKEEPNEVSDHLSPNRRPRSSSRHSQSRSTSSAEDDSSNIFDKPETLLRTPPSSRTTHTSPTPPASFLSTLKSKAAAADKQALSNQAKEAMRKWGVNWGGLRRDGGSGGGNTTHDDISDVGPSESRNRTDSNSQKNRGSYADVRAAVAERKEREKNGQVDSITTSLPVAIPEGGRIKVRSVSTSSGVSPGTVQVHPPSPSFSAVSTPPSPSGLPAQNSGSPEGGTLPKVAATSLSRSTTGSQSTDPFSNDRDALEGADTRPASLPPPIHTQPSHAKTMTIPGIHASHRGEVMSMGFVAPSPPPSAENKMKAPAIQSVYRLWKSPTLSGQQQQEPDTEPLSQQPTDSPEQNRDVVPLSLNPESSSQLPPRPIPPPLPPRSNSSAMPRTRPETPPPTAERARPVSPASEALEALKSIATKDENKRNGSRDGTEPTVSLSHSSSHDDVAGKSLAVSDTKPPLPPRRISTSA